MALTTMRATVKMARNEWRRCIPRGTARMIRLGRVGRAVLSVAAWTLLVGAGLAAAANDLRMAMQLGAIALAMAAALVGDRLVSRREGDRRSAHERD